MQDRKTLDAIAQCWPDAFGLALQLTRDRGRAEDLCQEACLRLSRLERPLDLGRPLLPYLLTVVRNLAHVELGRPGPVSLEEGCLAEPVDPRGVTPELEACRNEEHEAIDLALHAIAPHWRAAVYLKDGLGLTYRVIGEILGMSEDVVRVTLHRARMQVRRILGPSLQEEER